MLLRGPLLLSLTLLLTACGSKSVATRTEVVYVPQPQPVRKELVAQVEEPKAPEGPLTNDDLATLILALQEWGRGAYKKLAEIGETHPPQE
jgi:hypothetical protein